MKRFNQIVIIAILLILALPLFGQADSSARVTLSCSDVWVGDDEQASLKIDVFNQGADPITVTSYTVNGQNTAESVTIDSGSTHRFNIKTTIDFGEQTQKSIISSMEIDGLGTVYSNAIVLYRKSSVPAELTVDPLSSVVDSGETVDYTITFTNNSAYDYTDVTISLDDKAIVTAFTCAAGESQAFSYSKTYTQPSEHIFSFTFDYMETDGSTRTSGGSERALISVYKSQPTGSILPGAELLPSVLTAMADEDSGYELRLYLKNNSDTILTSVHVYDQNGTDYGGWSKIGIGKTAGMTVALTPVEETTYIFTAYGEDANGDMRMMTADAVLIAVGSLPDSFGTIDNTETVADVVESSEPVTIAEASTNKTVYLVLGVVVGAIVLSLLVIILISSGRKTIVKTKPKKKSSKGKSGRNII